MKISLNVIKQFINFELPPIDELTEKINSQLGVIEEVVNLNKKYGGAKIVRVVECEKHPDADRLSVTKIYDGGVIDGVPRDENGLVRVVCGAPNVHAGMLAVWLPPKSVVPATFNDEEPFVLDARKLRGVLSQGMLAASDELDIGSDHEGIIDIKPIEVGVDKAEDFQAGKSFAEVFGLDDYVIDIENKMFTHRPDLFGHLGVAREIAGIFGHKFENPDFYQKMPIFSEAEGLSLEVFNETNGGSARFCAVAFSGVKVQPSPLWFQCELVSMGAKPINNIVDITNYLMLITAQPTHAYDYDKISGAKIGVRFAKEGEKAKLLNQKEYVLSSDDLVIADNSGVVGLAGIMGGLDSEVSDETKNIILEVANFNMYTLRKTAMRHGIFTDALTRFNKGQSVSQVPYVLDFASEFLGILSGAHQASEVFDLGETSEITRNIDVDVKFINERLGSNLSADEISTLLENVNFKVEVDSDNLNIAVPFWRTDIELNEDIVEEVGRLYGFDKLPVELPRKSIAIAKPNARRELKSRIRGLMSAFGANESLQYSFVHSDVIKKSGQDVKKAFALSNALSPDLQNYRLSVLPSILQGAYSNIRAGHDEFVIYEFGKAHNLDYGFDAEDLPIEKNFFDGVFVSKNQVNGAPFYQARLYVFEVLKRLGVDVEFDVLGESDYDSQALAVFNPNRTATVKINGAVLGVVGELKSSVRSNFKLPDFCAGWSIDVDVLLEFSSEKTTSYRPLSRYPATNRDICFRIDRTAKYGEFEKIIKRSVGDFDQVVIDYELIDIYQPEDDSKKQITFRFTIIPQEKTLDRKEINDIQESITQRVLDNFSAEVL